MSNASDFADGAAYEQLMGRWSRIVGRQFLEWCAPPPGLDWLDVGCGNGAFTEEIIAGTSPRSIVGIDPAPGQIAFAQTRAGAAQAVFSVGDAQDLPFEDARFDVVTMGLVIAFVPEPARAVAEMKRVARRGGAVHTYMWETGQSPLAPLQRALRAMEMAPASTPSGDIATEAGLRAVWEGAGLADVATTRLTLKVRFESEADFLSSMTLPLGPQADRLRSLGADAKQELEARLRQAVPAGEDGSISYAAVANAVRGRV